VNLVTFLDNFVALKEIPVLKIGLCNGLIYEAIDVVLKFNKKVIMDKKANRITLQHIARKRNDCERFGTGIFQRMC